jgi:hypothetical protein
MKFLSAIILGVILGFVANSQVDLKRQSKNADFSEFPTTKPFKTGTILPVTCSVGEVYFKTDVTPGQNLYGCTSSGWTVMGNSTPQGGSGGATMFSQLGDFRIVRTSSTTLSVGSNCSMETPCTARFNEVTTSWFFGATVTLAGGTGDIRVYLDGSIPGSTVLKVRRTAPTLNPSPPPTLLDFDVGCSGMGCTSEIGTMFPPDSIPLYIWSASSGVWNAAGSDLRASLNLSPLQCGLCIPVP